MNKAENKFTEEEWKLLNQFYNSKLLIYKNNTAEHMVIVQAEYKEVYEDENEETYCSWQNDIVTVYDDSGEPAYKIHLEGINQWEHEYEAAYDAACKKQNSRYAETFDNFDWDAFNIRGLKFAMQIRRALPEKDFDVWYSYSYTDTEHKGSCVKLIVKNSEVLLFTGDENTCNENYKPSSFKISKESVEKSIEDFLKSYKNNHRS